MANAENNENATRTAPTQTSQPAAGALVRNQKGSSALARPLGNFGPFALMRELFEALGRLTGLGTPGRQIDEANGLDALMFTPLVEVMHRDDKLIVNVDLPGTAVDDIRVIVDDGALIIEGERRGEREQQDGGVWRSERLYGRFHRVIALPEGVEPSTAEARFEDGVLEISLGAPEPARKGGRIEIKTNPKSSEPANQAGAS